MLITRKSIFAVLIALFVVAGFGIASAAQVGGLASNSGVALPVGLNNFVNPAGVGDTLIYNYYNARNGYQTFFTVVNTDSANGIRARVRLREAADVAKNGVCTPEEPRGSFEILDFDLCLSANDVWTGYITIDSTTGAAKLCSIDTDTLIQDGITPGHVFPSNCVLTKFGSNGLANGNITADDTLEGYIEVIGERTIAADPLTCGNPGVTSGTNRDQDTNVGDATNSLFGNVAIASLAPAGATFTYDATAIGDFAAGDIANGVQTSQPDLTSGSNGLVGVNFILSKNMLYSIYDLDNARSESIVTIPTKALTQQCGPNNDIFDDDRVTLQFFDDKEHPTTGSGCAYSPCLPSQEDHLPFEVNAILPRVGNSIMTAGTDSIEVLPLIQTPYNFGWYFVDLNRAGTTPIHATTFGIPGTTSFGWPTLGITLLDINSGVSTGVFQMQYMTDVH